MHQVRAELAHPEERQVRRVLRRLDSRSQVPGGHGRLRRERQVPAAEVERHDAVSRRLRGGRLPEESGSVRAARRPAARGQLHQSPRLAHADEEERAERAVGHEAVQHDEPGEAEAADSMMPAAGRLLTRESDNLNLVIPPLLRTSSSVSLQGNS